MPNLKLRRKKKLSPFRRMAIGTWQTTYDPSVYGSITLHMDEAERYLNEFRERTGKRLTYSHMMAKAVAHVFEKMPDANAIVRFNHIYLRERIGVFFQVVLEDKQTGEIDLTGATIYDPETMNLEQIVDEFERKTLRARKGEDKETEKSRGMFRWIPSLMLNPFLKTMSFLSYTLNLDLRSIGVPQDPFGSVMITNIGSLGLSEAYVPLVPYSRVPLLVAMGAVEDKARVVDGEIKIVKEMQICATFDHRVLDGMHAAVMSKTLQDWMEEPYKKFGPIPERVHGTGDDAEDAA